MARLLTDKWLAAVNTIGSEIRSLALLFFYGFVDLVYQENTFKKNKKDKTPLQTVYFLIKTTFWNTGGPL